MEDVLDQLHATNSSVSCVTLKYLFNLLEARISPTSNQNRDGIHVNPQIIITAACRSAGFAGMSHFDEQQAETQGVYLRSIFVVHNYRTHVKNPVVSFGKHLLC